MIQDIYYSHLMGGKLSLRKGKKVSQGHRNNKQENEPVFLWLQTLRSPSCPLYPVGTGKLKRQNSGFHQIYFLTSFIHRSRLHTCTTQIADLIILFLMIFYIYQCPAGPGLTDLGEMPKPFVSSHKFVFRGVYANSGTPFHSFPFSLWSLVSIYLLVFCHQLTIHTANSKHLPLGPTSERVTYKPPRVIHTACLRASWTCSMTVEDNFHLPFFQAVWCMASDFLSLGT